MPQTFQVLKCYKCFVFQVHQTKKSNKFQCKMCGEKQSIKRHYGVGNGQECRFHVQKLNTMRGEINLKEIATNSLSSSDEDEPATIIKSPQKKISSKWSDYVDKTDNNLGAEETEDTEICLEIPKKKFRKSRQSNAFSSKNKSSSHSRQDCVEDIPLSYTSSLITVSDSSNDTKSESFKIDKENIISKSHDVMKVDYGSGVKNFKPKKTIFKPPPVSKTSKWSTYAEEENTSSLTQENETIDDNAEFLQEYEQDNLLRSKDLNIRNIFSHSESRGNELSFQQKTFTSLNNETSYNESKNAGSQNNVQSLFAFNSDDSNIDNLLDI